MCSNMNAFCKYRNINTICQMIIFQMCIFTFKYVCIQLQYVFPLNNKGVQKIVQKDLSIVGY